MFTYLSESEFDSNGACSIKGETKLTANYGLFKGLKSLDLSVGPNNYKLTGE